MTEQERIIVSAYTGYLLCDFSKVHEYIEKKMGRPVWTHEMAYEEIQDQIREKCKADFLALTKSARPGGKWIDRDGWKFCSECNNRAGEQANGVAIEPLCTNYCGECGAYMYGGEK